VRERLFSLLLILPFLAASPCAGATPNEKSFDIVWQTVHETHYDPAFGGLDWKDAYRRYRPLVADAKNDAEFYARTNRMLFELRLSHLLVVTTEELKHALPDLFAEGTIGVDIRLINGEAVVTSVKDRSPGAAAGIRPGHLVRSVDGKSIRELERKGEAMRVPPFNRRNRTNLAARRVLGQIYGPPGTYVRLVLEDPRGGVYARRIEREKRGNGRVFSEALPPFFVEFERRVIENNVAYVRFNHFAAPVAEEFTAALEVMKNVRGLIIDLRGNSGGFFSVVNAVAKRLIARKTVFASYRFRDRTVPNILSPTGGDYDMPIVVLVDVMSMSAAEFFAGCMQAIGRATITGDRTPGYMLAAGWKKLPNGGAFMHTIFEPRTADGTVLEDRGVVPDSQVALDKRLLLKGNDSQIEAAVRHILRLSK
jgi:carboxyl-terminal processing protease